MAVLYTYFRFLMKNYHLPAALENAFSMKKQRFELKFWSETCPSFSAGKR
jgi:hypothetical protein